MKSYFFLSFLLTLSLFYSHAAIAQKVKIKKKVVTIDKVPYCKTNCGGAFTQDCKIQNLDGETLVSLILHSYQTSEVEESMYEIIFVGTDYTAQKDASFSFTKKLMKEFFKYEVIKEGKLNEVGVQKFVKEYSENLKDRYAAREAKHLGKPAPATSETIKKEVKHNLVERKRSAEIMIIGEKIQQDFKEIGRYESENIMEGTTIIQNFSFYLPDGTLVARVTMEEFSKTGNCQVITSKDNEKHTISIQSKDKMAKVKEMASFLVKRLYL